MIRRSVFVAFLAVAATLTAQGQNTGSTRIALVSLQETITRTQEGQQRTQQLRAKYKPEEDNIKTKQAEIGRLQNQLAEGSNIMSDAAKRKLQRSIETKRREAQRAVEDAEAAFQKEVQALQQDLYGKVRVIIRDYMIEKDYSLILDISNPQTPVVDAKTELLITNDIIERYDQKHPVSAATSSSAAPAAAAQD